MGGGPKQPNTPTVPRRNRDRMDSSGELAKPCPLEGRAPLETSEELGVGMEGSLVAMSTDVAFVIKGEAAGLLRGREAERLFKCIGDGFSYVGETEQRNGSLFVRFRMA
jgi:hypothetical protein